MRTELSAKRRQYRVAISRGNECLAERIAYAHNSGIRASEALVREYARNHGVLMHGGKPVRDDSGYTRVWRSSDGSLEVTATVVPVKAGHGYGPGIEEMR